jgi:hypothetical protein
VGDASDIWRALSMAAGLDARRRRAMPGVWLERVLDEVADELVESVSVEAGLPVMWDRARVVALALTLATASTANDPMLVPGEIADTLAHVLAIYVIAVEVASVT